MSNLYTLLDSAGDLTYPVFVRSGKVYCPEVLGII